MSWIGLFLGLWGALLFIGGTKESDDLQKILGNSALGALNLALVFFNACQIVREIFQ